MDLQETRAVLGRNIHHLRLSYGMGRKTLAKLVNIPVGRLRRIECCDPKAKLYDFHLCRLARIFDVTVEMLLDPGNHNK